MRTIVISGVIGLDVQPADIRAALDAAGSKPVTVEIASPGGFVAEGLEIHSMIKNYPGPLTIRLTGLAASMASFIATAAPRVEAESTAVYMIHNAAGGKFGNQNDLRRFADVIEMFSGILAEGYAHKSGKSLAAIRKLMDSETWMSAVQAKAEGFVDAILAPSGRATGSITAARASFAAAQARLNAPGLIESVDRIAASLGAVMPLSDEDREAARLFGMSEDEYHQYARIARKE